MDHVLVKKIFKKWAVQETWHTGHPLDDRRFHRSLAELIKEYNNEIGISFVKEVLEEMIEEFHPTLNEAFREEKLLRFALRMEAISSYLEDAQGI